MKRENDTFTLPPFGNRTVTGDRYLSHFSSFQAPDDEIIMLDTLYYTGSAIGNQLNLPKNPHEAKTDVVKMCIQNMHRDHLEFGKPKSDGEINVDSKMASSIIKFVKMAMDLIDWDKKEG